MLHYSWPPFDYPLVIIFYYCSSIFGTYVKMSYSFQSRRNDLYDCGACVSFVVFISCCIIYVITFSIVKACELFLKDY
jgi:hypothetical protein